MNAYQALVDHWQVASRGLLSSRPFQRLAAGTLTRREYAACLRQIFHHARENPQLQALATARFRGEQRELVKAFLRHAGSEIGHDQLALDDIQALGEDVTGIRDERPLPATFALLASAFHMLEHHTPVAYLGYLFQLEYTPIQVGPAFLEGLTRCGIPREAMTFLAEHATADVAHCKLMEQYCEKLIGTEEDLSAALYMQDLTAELYRRMLEEACASAERWQDLSPANPEEGSVPRRLAPLLASAS